VALPRFALLERVALPRFALLERVALPRFALLERGLAKSQKNWPCADRPDLYL
jgi:hypothetical protein